MMKFCDIAVLIAIILLSSISLYSQNPTDIQCIEVNADGSIQITWEQYANTDGNFTGYQVNRRLNALGETYDAITPSLITNINTTSFTDNDVTINANINSYCYYITLALGTDPAYNSNELCSILLNGTSDLPTGLVDLNWNDPVPPGSSVPNGTVYNLYFEDPPGTWVLDSTFDYEPNLTSFTHEAKVCSGFVNFRLDLALPNATCASTSNIINLEVEDNTAPAIPEITSVTVDPNTGLAVLNWNEVQDLDLAGYVIYECINGSEFVLATLADPLLESYTDPASSPATNVENYLMASFDNCPQGSDPGNLSTTVPSDAPFICPSLNTTILLEYDWQECDDNVRLNWNQYTGWGDDGVAYYEMYKSINGNPFIIIDPFIAPEEDSYIDADIQNGDTYEYYVRAQRTNVFDGISQSNISSLTITSPILPPNFSLFSASVTDEKEITVTPISSPTVTPFQYVLQRRREDEPFSREIDYFTTDNFVPEFIDLDVEPSIFSYDYQISLVDICTDTVAVSDLGRTIVLEGITNKESLTNSLSWNKYEDWTNGVEEYEIYSSIDGAPPVLIGTSGPSILFHEEDVSNYLDSKGEFCYTIIAKESNNPLFNATSSSNTLCLSQEPLIWIPNAFAVNGINSEFKPTISFADKDTYRMIIYNRWGQEIFQTRDIDEGWDGTKNGNLIQEGSYMYYIEIQDGLGRLYEHRGPVTLLIFDAN